jgi:glycosyltransferase involved in cell wall biosynthesis
MSKSSTLDIPLLLFIGESDWDIFPHFIKHYEALGVNEFCLAVHGQTPRHMENYINVRDNISIKRRISEPFTEKLKTRVLTNMASAFKDRWILTVDTDEFLTLPLSSISETIKVLKNFGMLSLPALLLQRLSADGALSKLTDDDDITDLFPAYDFNLCENMGLGVPCWKLKFPLAYVSEEFKVQRGFHLSPNKVSNDLEPVRAVLSHYKWREALNKSFEGYRGEDTNFREMDIYASYLKDHEGVLPTSHARPFSEDDLFSRGLLIKPSELQNNIYSFIGDLKKYHQSSLISSKKLESKFASFKDDWDAFQAEYENPLEFSKIFEKPGKIGFVTFEILGPSNCGGIGTAVSILAETLASAGHEVEVIYCPENQAQKMNEAWLEYWAAKGITVKEYTKFGQQFYTSYRANAEFHRGLTDFIEKQGYDIVHFDDSSGYAYNVLTERAAGRRFQDTQIITTTHGNTRWHFVGNKMPWQRSEALNDVCFATHMSLSDIVVHPSRYMKDLTASETIEAVPNYVVPNALLGLSRSFSSQSAGERKAVKEIVFFGRIELRKGLDLFVNTTKKLARESEHKFKITFLGKFGAGMSQKDIVREYDNIDVNVDFLTNYNSLDAVNYLKTHDCLVVLASTMDNLPYTIYECLENKIPMLCTDVGGISDLIDPKDLKRITFTPDVNSLSKKISHILDRGMVPGQLRFDPDVVVLYFLTLFGDLLSTGRQQKKSVAKKSLSVAAILLESETNTYAKGNIEKFIEKSQIFKFDGYTDKEILNREVKRLRSKYIVLASKEISLINDTALPSVLKLLDKSEAAAVVCHYKYPKTTDNDVDDVMDTIYVPHSSRELAFSWNVCGADFVVVRRKSFIEMGGLEFHGSSPHICWEIVNRLLASDQRVICFPDALIKVPDLNKYSFVVNDEPLFYARLASAWTNRTEDEALKHIIRSASTVGSWPCLHQQQIKAACQNLGNGQPKKLSRKRRLYNKIKLSLPIRMNGK